MSLMSLTTQLMSMEKGHSHHAINEKMNVL
jgi:hypothetical protein